MGDQAAVESLSSLICLNFGIAVSGRFAVPL